MDCPLEVTPLFSFRHFHSAGTTRGSHWSKIKEKVAKDFFSYLRSERKIKMGGVNVTLLNLTERA